MKKICLLAILPFIISSVFCQNFDELLVSKQIDCADISKNSSLYFIKYINEDKIDSAEILLNYWESKCGLREPIFRAKILLALYTREFNETLLTETPLNFIFNYQNRMNLIKYAKHYIYDNYKSYYGYIPPGEQFDIFTQQWALELKSYYYSESIEYLLAEFYSDNYEVIFSKIQSKTFENCFLTKKYNEVLNTYKNLYEVHISFLTGIWIPTGRLAKIGIHPELGFQMGWKKKRMNYDLTLAIKFVNAPNDYYARRGAGKDRELTNHFFGGYIGFEAGGDVFVRKKHEIQVTGGVAWDGFDVLKEDKERELKPASTSSFNINFGVAYRYYITSNLYISLRAKYNVVDYSLNKVIDFTGNPVTVQFLIGYVKNSLKDANLKALEYKLRK